jgi:phage FluMu protein Com
MFFKSDDTHYSSSDICSIIEKECTDIYITNKPPQVKVINNTNNTNNNTNNMNNNNKYRVKVINKFKSQQWHLS